MYASELAQKLIELISKHGDREVFGGWLSSGDQGPVDSVEFDPSGGGIWIDGEEQP